MVFRQMPDHDRRNPDDALYRELYAHMETLAERVHDLSGHINQLTAMAVKVENNQQEIARLRDGQDRLRDLVEENNKQKLETAKDGTSLEVKPITVTIFLAAVGWLVTMFIKLVEWSRE